MASNPPGRNFDVSEEQMYQAILKRYHKLKQAKLRSKYGYDALDFRSDAAREFESSSPNYETEMALPPPPKTIKKMKKRFWKKAAKKTIRRKGWPIDFSSLPSRKKLKKLYGIKKTKKSRRQPLFTMEGEGLYARGASAGLMTARGASAGLMTARGCRGAGCSSSDEEMVCTTAQPMTGGFAGAAVMAALPTILSVGSTVASLAAPLVKKAIAKFREWRAKRKARGETGLPKTPKISTKNLTPEQPIVMTGKGVWEAAMRTAKKALIKAGMRKPKKFLQAGARQILPAGFLERLSKKRLASKIGGMKPLTARNVFKPLIKRYNPKLWRSMPKGAVTGEGIVGDLAKIAGFLIPAAGMSLSETVKGAASWVPFILQGISNFMGAHKAKLIDVGLRAASTTGQIARALGSAIPKSAKKISAGLLAAMLMGTSGAMITKKSASMTNPLAQAAMETAGSILKGESTKAVVPQYHESEFLKTALAKSSTTSALKIAKEEDKLRKKIAKVEAATAKIVEKPITTTAAAKVSKNATELEDMTQQLAALELKAAEDKAALKWARQQAALKEAEESSARRAERLAATMERAKETPEEKRKRKKAARAATLAKIAEATRPASLSEVMVTPRSVAPKKKKPVSWSELSGTGAGPIPMNETPLERTFQGLGLKPLKKRKVAKEVAAAMNPYACMRRASGVTYGQGLTTCDAARNRCRALSVYTAAKKTNSAL